MDRRTFLTAGATALGAGLVGCLGDGDAATATERTDAGTPTATITDDPASLTGDDETTTAGDGGTATSGGEGTADPDPDDGYPPEAAIPSVPEERFVPSAFPTTTQDGVEIPLLPMDVTHYWWARREARFADARGREQYRAQHVVGAVSSPAGSALDGPVADWPTGDRIVCYCGCPHHLSSIRAATLYEAGYEEVYVIDEGYWAWKEAGHPVAGEAVASVPPLYVIEGRTDPADAGATAWVRHPASGQREAAEIGDDGRYRLHVRFVGVGPGATVVVETPEYAVRGPLAELAEGTVSGP